MNGLSGIANVNKMSFVHYYAELESTPANVTKIWLVLLVSALVYSVLAWAALLAVDRY